jgi:hypothetical protein
MISKGMPTSRKAPKITKEVSTASSVSARGSMSSFCRREGRGGGADNMEGGTGVHVHGHFVVVFVRRAGRIHCVGQVNRSFGHWGGRCFVGKARVARGSVYRAVIICSPDGQTPDGKERTAILRNTHPRLGRPGRKITPAGAPGDCSRFRKPVRELLKQEWEFLKIELYLLRIVISKLFAFLFEKFYSFL